MILRAYFDESDRQGGTFCVAGYVFSPDDAKKGCKEWRRAMHGRTFHAKTFNPGIREFADWNQPFRSAIYARLVATIRRRACFGVVASCCPTSMQGEWIRSLPGYRTPYGLCCHLCMLGLNVWLEEIGSEARIAYVFEAGHSAQNEAEKFLFLVSQDAGLREEYRYLSHSFVTKDALPILAASDLLAWEWTKNRDDEERPARKSIEALFEPSERMTHHTAHLEGGDLDAHLDHVRETYRQKAAGYGVAHELPSPL